MPLHVVCVCEKNTHSKQLQELFKRVLTKLASALPRWDVPAASEAGKLALAPPGAPKLVGKAPMGDVTMEPLLFLTEVPKKASVLEVQLGLARCVVVIDQCLKESVFGSHGKCCHGNTG